MSETTQRVDAAGEPLRLLAVHAHPDDESSKGAASVAKYVAEGVQVLVATLTGGERGDILNPRMDTPENWANIGPLRAAEMAHAREILGVEQTWLGFIDSGLPQGDPLPPLPDGCFALVPLEEAARALVKVIRTFRPHVVTTYDENGGYPHPDHIRCHEVTMAAVEAASDPDAYPEAGEPWAVLKVYYHMTFHRQRMVALDKATGAVRWTYVMNKYTWSSPIAIYDANGNAYIVVCEGSNTGGKVFLLDGKTGTLLDTFEAEKNIEASPAAYGNMIVFGTRGMKIWGVKIS